MHRPVFCNENENGRRFWREKEIGWAAIKHNPRRRSRRILAGRIRDFYKLIGRRIDWNDARCPGCWIDRIKSRRATRIVRNPPRTARTGNQSPGILQVGIIHWSIPSVGDQICLRVLLREHRARKRTRRQAKSYNPFHERNLILHSFASVFLVTPCFAES